MMQSTSESRKGFAAWLTQKWRRLVGALVQDCPPELDDELQRYIRLRNLSHS